MFTIDKLDQQDSRNKINISLFYVDYYIKWCQGLMHYW